MGQKGDNVIIVHSYGRLKHFTYFIICSLSMKDINKWYHTILYINTYKHIENR